METPKSLTHHTNFVYATWQPTCFPLQDTSLLYSFGKHGCNKRIHARIQSRWHSVTNLTSFNCVCGLPDKGVISRRSIATNGKMISEQWTENKVEGTDHGLHEAWSPHLTAGLAEYPAETRTRHSMKKKLQQFNATQFVPQSKPTAQSFLRRWQPLNWPNDIPCCKEFHSSFSYSRKPTPGS